MSSFVITGTNTTAQTLLDTEFGYIAAGHALVVNGADALTGSGANQVSVLGNLASFGDFEAYDFDGTDLDLVIGTAGSVFALSDDALDLTASTRIEVTNMGAINADLTAISAQSSDSSAFITIQNTGTITGATGISANGGTGAIKITNSGVISTSSQAITTGAASGTTVIVNSGTIESATNSALNLGGGSDRVYNTGVVIGGATLGAGNDFYDGSSGVLIGLLNGGIGSDTLLGGAGSETISGGTDADLIHAGGGNDTIIADYFDASNDTINGGDGIDTVTFDGDPNGIWVDLASGFAQSGLNGNDILISIENVIGGFGTDRLIGDDGDNMLYGAGGEDTLVGGHGADLLDGGASIDTVDYSDAEAAVLVYLDGKASFGGARGDVLVDIEVLLGSDYADTLVGSNGNDTFRGGAGNDTIYASDGADVLDGGLGADVLFGQDGDDTLFGSSGTDTLNGGNDNDTADYSNAAAGVGLRLDGVANFGWATGDVFASIENLTGGNFNDFLVGNGAGQSLIGGGGNDAIYANGGNDTIVGGTGNDTMFGQGGSDEFVFDDGFGNDTIGGFDATDNNEVINLVGVLTLTSFAQLQTGGRMTQVGGNVVIDNLIGDTITLTGVNLADLDANDFIF